MSSARGSLIVFAGPSGAGKTTLARHLVEKFHTAEFSVSTTTREIRGEEKDGIDYRFVSQEEFRERIDAGYFLEWAEVHGQLYGTSREWVEERLDLGRQVILDIDVQGAVQVKSSYPDSVLVFILPPSPSLLGSRLSERRTDHPSEVETRMETAAWEIGWIGMFDYFIRNDILAGSLDTAEAIFRSERARLSSMPFPEEARLYSPHLFRGRDYWSGKISMVVSGPTREPIDDVRFISNRSSGLMGRSIAESLRDAGSDVLFVTGPACFPAPEGVSRIDVSSAEEMLEVVKARARDMQFLAMTAAVSDFRPVERMTGKMERSGDLVLELEATPDILATLTRIPGDICPVLAYALEMGPGGEKRASEKMRRKGATAIFLNRGDIPGSGMDSQVNQGKLIFDDGTSQSIASCSKRFMAELTVAAVGRYLESKELEQK